MLELVIVLVVVVGLLIAIAAVLVVGLRRRREARSAAAQAPDTLLRAGDDPARDEIADDFTRGRGGNTGLTF